MEIAGREQYTPEQWNALRRFYAGERARQIRRDYPGIWSLVAQFRDQIAFDHMLGQLRREIWDSKTDEEKWL